MEENLPVRDGPGYLKPPVYIHLLKYTFQTRTIYYIYLYVRLTVLICSNNIVTLHRTPVLQCIVPIKQSFIQIHTKY